MNSRPWPARLFAWTIAAPQRDAIVDDLVDDYLAARRTGPASRAARQLCRDLLSSAIDSRRHAWLELRERRAHTRGPLMSSLTSDLKSAWRQHIGHPAGTASALLTIALAVGVNTALVSVTHAVLFKPLPLKDPDHLVFVWTLRANHPDPLTPGRALDVRARTRALEDAALLDHTSMTVTGLGPPERWSGSSVSSSFFDVLGTPPERGQLFHRADRGRDLVVLSHRLWMTRFGGDESVIGRSLMMSGRPRVVVGVMPAEFFWPAITGRPTSSDGPDFWTCAPGNDVPEGPIPTDGDFSSNRTAGFIRMVARLAPGATRATAQAEMTAVAEALGREHPTTDGGIGFTTASVDEQFFGGVRTPMLFLMWASGLVVLLACVNVANLLIMRLPSRARELAIRVALGAGRGRLVRQLLAEGLLLAAGGGLAGVVIARLSLGALVSLAPSGIGRLDHVVINMPVLLVTGLAVLGCGLVMGTFPALIVWRMRPMAELRTSGVSLASRPGFRHALVALEVALAVSLVVGAALFGESLMRLRRVDVGFDTSRLLTFNVALIGERAEYQSKQIAFFEQMFTAIRSIPDVAGAGGAVTLPIGGDDFGAPIFPEGQPLPAPGAERHVGFQIVGTGWFSTLGMRVVSGRDFTMQDGRRDAPVAVVNETMASTVWPGQDPIGRRLKLDPSDAKPWITVIGVVSDIRHLGPGRPPRPEMYEPYYQGSLPFLAVAVRTAHDPLAVVPAIRAAVATLDPSQPISDVSTMDRHLTRAYGDGTFLSTLTLGFGALALGLAIVGVYGVVGWSSAQRTREFGLRSALGATPGSLSGLVLRQGMRPVVAGVVFGAGAALLAAQSIRGLLFDTAPAEPAVYGVAVTTVVLAAVVACWIPARRAAKIDPVRALTAEP
ncbi:MAG TPA: ABC transporter permease [Vicinamibacterales bacterium]|nr:ABC transporter permease [Vicinamibacterales bacterium]